MKMLIFINVFFAACTTLPTNNLEQTWNIIEKASNEHWKKNRLENELGKATEEIKNPIKKIYLALLYKKNNRQEWGITISKENTVESVTYLPTGPHRREFTIEKIKDRWKDLNCKKEERQTVTPHVIKKERSISCDNGKRIIHYNRYNQIESILVKDQ